MTYRRIPSGLWVPELAYRERPETREIATTLDGRDITRGYVQAMTRLLPGDPILKNRLGGDYGLYREVLSDAQVAALLTQRRMALLRTEWEVTPGGERRIDRRAADLLSETLDRIRWDEVLGWMHYGIFYGFAVGECIWEPQGGQVQLAAIRVRDRARFAFDGAGRLRLRTLSAPDGELLPERKFWVFRTGADHSDEPYGLGLAHWLYWPVLFKRQNIRFWLIAAEKFGSPTLTGIFPPSASEQEQQKLLEALEAIQTDSGVIIPDDMRIELLESGRSSGMDYAVLCEYMDRLIAKIILGQIMTSEAVGGQYKAEVQDQAKDDIVKSDADLLCASFNISVVRWLIDFNLPGAAYPKVWRRIEEAEDLTARAQRDRMIFDMGYRPTLAYITETYGGEWEPRDTTATATEVPAATASAPTGEPSPEDGESPPAAYAETETPVAQALIDAEAQRDPGWAAVTEALFAPLFAALREGLTPAELLATLKGETEETDLLDDGLLVETLTQAIVAAQALGYLEASNE